MKQAILAAVASVAAVLMANVDTAAACSVKHTDVTQSTVTKTLNRPRSKQSNNNLNKHPHWAAGSGTYAPMDAWEVEGVTNLNQKYLTFTILNKPTKANVKNIAFFVAGQEVCWGQHQIVTGTDDNWRHKINQAFGNNNWKAFDTKLDKRSAAWIFMDGLNKPHSYSEDLRVFDLTNTLVIDIADAAFSYPGALSNSIGEAGNCNTGNTMEQNNRVIKGWKRWLDANVEWGNIKAFFGAGWSRGGCFVTRLSDYLFSNSPALRCNAKLILETFDPVCHPDEMPSSVRDGDEVENPLKSNYKCRQIKVKNLFGDTPRQNIRWRSTIGGDAVAVIARAVCDENTDGSTQNLQLHDDGTVDKNGDLSLDGDADMPDCNDCWYEQNYTGKAHAYIGAHFNHENVGTVSCTGQSKCGYGTNAACIPGSRADQDSVYKHMSHAAKWGAVSSKAHNPNRYNYNCQNPQPLPYPTLRPQTWMPAPVDSTYIETNYKSGTIVADLNYEVEPIWTQYWDATRAGSAVVADFVARNDAGDLIDTINYGVPERFVEDSTAKSF